MRSSEKDIKSMANKSWNNEDFTTRLTEQGMATASVIYPIAYEKGFRDGQDKIIENASEGFDDWDKVTSSRLANGKDAWQASRISTMRDIGLNGIICECMTNCDCIEKMKKRLEAADELIAIGGGSQKDASLA